MRTVPAKILTTFFVAVTFSMTIYSLWVAGPHLEEWALGPVVSKMRVVSIRQGGRGSLIDVEFEKLRDCTYVGITWYHRRADGRAERVPVILHRRVYDTSSPNRPLGPQRAGPWEVELSPADLTLRSFAQLYHRCHGLWLTTTDFYP